MASTNHTTNYNLSQYVGSDKPTYLGDYNSDMSKIDTQMKTNADNNTITDGKIGTLTNLTTTTQSNLVAAINEVDGNCDTNAGAISTTNTNIGTLANLTTENKTSVVNAINEVNAAVGNFNFVNFDNLTFTTTTGTIDKNDLKIATNADGSLCKIYGSIRLTGYSPFSTPTIKTDTPTSLRPDSDITINGFSKFYQDGTGNITGCDEASITIKTNGDIEIASNLLNNNYTRFILAPCIIFVKDFGDAPVNE